MIKGHDPADRERDGVGGAPACCLSLGFGILNAACLTY